MALELWTRVRSLVHRGGARKDRGSLYVVVAATAGGVVGAVLLADDVPTTSWLSLVVLTVVPTAGLVVRIHVEERALLEALGEPYRRYAAGRRRLVPGVW